jgi:transposase
MNQHRTFEVWTAEPVRSRRKLRRWSDEEKAQLIAEAFAPGANVSAIARSHGLDPSQVYAWRRKALASGMVAPLVEHCVVVEVVPVVEAARRRPHTVTVPS